ncbi:MAG TPA: trypsin-like peptidase domain-containing protein [Allosphingosinicella sp.]
MTAQIRPNRLEVNDRFPMLGFSIRADQRDVEAEVALATDIELFKPENRGRRTAANFYSSRETGKLAIPRGEGVFVVPPDILSRFIGGDRLYFGLASGHANNGGLQVDALPRDGSPFVSLRGLTGRTIRRSPRRGPSRPPLFDWAGDAARPGSERPANGGGNGGNGASHGANGGGGQQSASAPRSEIDYDDGFGDLPATPRPSNGGQAPVSAQALSIPAVRAMSDTPVAVTPPSVTVLGTVARMAIEAGILALGGPLGALVLSLKTAANALGCSVGFGPQVGAGLGAGGQLGCGIIFAPNNEIGVYGATEIDIGFITSISATANVTIVRGGINAFNGWSGALAISGGEGVVGGGAALFDPQGNFVGVSANVGIGAGFSPVDFYVAAQRGWATRVLALAAAAGNPALARPLAQVTMIYTPSDPAQAATALAEFSARQSAWRAGVPDTTFFPHNAICHIEATGADGRTYLGTGTYVARDLILTAAHVLRNKTSLRIRPGRNGSSHVADFTASPADWTIHPHWNPDSAFSDHDLGVIRVGTHKPAGPDFELHYLNVSQPSPIIVCGYAAGSVDPTRQHLDGDMIRELSPNMHVLRYNLQTEGGTSGSPVFYVDVYDDAERQQCVQEWKLVGVHSDRHDGVLNQGCALTPAKIDWIRGRGLSPPSAGFGAETASRAMTIGPEDVQRAQTYAPRWADLYNFQVPASVVSAIQARGMSVQRIADAHGELNLDRYEIVVDTPPPGMDGAELLKRFLHNINGFVDTDNTEFNPYGPADAAQIVSANPVGAVFNLNIIGPDNAAVVVSQANASHFRVSTVNTPDTGDHPVSGHREWGHSMRDGKIILYTRGADRATGSIATSVVFAGADHLWRSFQRKMVEYINANGGSAHAPAPFSERFHPEVVRILYGTAQSLGKGMAAEDASDQLVRPVLPGDQRARAQRIGGAFGERIGQALDLGLNPSSVDPLLEKLDPPSAPSPYGRQQAAREPGSAGADVPLPPAPPPRARAMGGGADAIIEIGGIVLDRILNNEGDVSWELDQFNGIKHPNDSAPANPAPFRDAPTIRLDSWPSSGGVLDDINAWFKIDWQYNGRSLGNVRIENVGSNDAVGWGLKVKARIINDARLYEPGQCAALRVTIHYKFERSIGSDQIGITEIKLYGDGTHEISQNWEQNSWLFGVSESKAGGGARALGVTQQHVRSPSGQTDYSLAQYDGMKQPARPGQAGQVQSAPTIQRGHRPWVDAGGGNSVRAPFSVDWQYDGSAVGNVRLTAGNAQEAQDWQTRVSSQIEDEADSPSGCAQLKVRVSHQFSHGGQIHATEWTEIILRGDGTADAHPQ